MGKRKKDYKYEGKKFKQQYINKIVNEYDPMKAYSFTHKDNLNDFNNIAKLLPHRYAAKKELQCIDWIYSGDTAGNFILTLLPQRIDTNHKEGKEMFDVDVFNIAPDIKEVNEYFSNQWFHFKDEKKARVTTKFSDKVLPNFSDKMAVLYKTHLFNNPSGFTFEDYNKAKTILFDCHRISFERLKKIK